MNNVILSGRITKDPEIKYNQNKPYCRFSIAVRNEFKNAQGNYDSQFVDCTGFDNDATYLQNYVHKGDMLLVQGRINVQNYMDKEGKNRTYTSILVRSIENMSFHQQGQQLQTNSQPQVNNQQYPNPNSYQQQPQPKPQPQPQQVEEEDTLPWL